MRTQVLLAAMVAALPTLADRDGPALVVGKFCAAHQRSSQDGVPDSKLHAKYGPYISPYLSTLLMEAAKAEECYAKANPDSPPMVEGDLFSSNFEGISSFRVDSCAVTRATALCRVRLRYATLNPRPQDKPVDWTDTVTLIRSSAGWRVDDIAFGGKRAFGNHGALKSVLKSAIGDAGK